MKMIKNIKKTLLVTGIFLIVLIVINRCYVAIYNNQFLKHIKYNSEIKSMGMKTTDLHSLIQSVIDNNKTSNKKVVIRCVIEGNNSVFKLAEERPQKSYSTVEELEWLLEKMNLNTSSISLGYNKKSGIIETIEIVIPKNEEFWKYIREFSKDEAKLTEIKDFFEKARNKQKDLIVEEKPVNIVYVVNNQDTMSVKSFEEEDVNQILEQLSEENTYRLLIQSYNNYYKISIMYYTK